MRIFLAPMEGVIDHHFRTIYGAIGGVDICVSEFVRVNDVPVPNKILLRTCPELNHPDAKDNTIGATPDGVPVRVQLLGSNPETMAITAHRAAKLGAAAIDLNFGCPAKAVNNSFGGSILLKQPELVGDIVNKVRKSVPASTPVTAKIRLGYEHRDLYLQNALAIYQAGADELCVHARSRADGYKPPAYWSCISEINQSISIPVVANGEIWNVADWQRCKSESNCQDFMLGRGLVACPDLALQIKAAAQKEPYQPLQWHELLVLLYRFYRETKDTYPQRFLGNRVKQWLFYLKMHYPEASRFFEQIKRYKRPEEFDHAFADVLIAARPRALSTL